MKRQRKVITPSQVLAETVGEEETNLDLIKKPTKRERKKESGKKRVPLTCVLICIKI